MSDDDGSGEYNRDMLDMDALLKKQGSEMIPEDAHNEDAHKKAAKGKNDAEAKAASSKVASPKSWDDYSTGTQNSLIAYENLRSIQKQNQYFL